MVMLYIKLKGMKHTIICSDAHMGGSRGDDRGPDPLKNLKNIGFLCITSQDSLKNHKPTKPAFDVGPSSAHQR